MTLNNLYLKSLKSEKIESGAMYGQFLINSLRPGQGITIGNLLRRVLLNDLGGTTITAVRIAGIRVTHGNIIYYDVINYYTFDILKISNIIRQKI